MVKTLNNEILSDLRVNYSLKIPTVSIVNYPKEIGRIVYDRTVNKFYICTVFGWKEIVIGSDRMTYSKNINLGISPITTLRDNNYVFLEQSEYANVKWGVRISGLNNEIRSRTTNDSDGNVLITGLYTSPIITFYDSDGTPVSTLLKDGNTNLFISKYDDKGNFNWATRITTSNPVVDRPDIVTDNQNSAIITGIFAPPSISFYDSDGSLSGTLSNNGVYDTFLAKYNPLGNLTWKTKIGGSINEMFPRVTTYNEEIFLVGIFTSPTVTFYNSDGSDGYTLNSSFYDIFVCKYSTLGFNQWVAQINTDLLFQVFTQSCSTDNLDDLFVTGLYKNSVITFNNSDRTTGLTLSNNNTVNGYSTFISKWDNNGFVEWATKLETVSGDQFVPNIITDNENNVIVTGQYSSSTLDIYDVTASIVSTLEFIGTFINVFLIKYDNNGFLEWSTKISGNNNIEIPSITTDNLNNIYISGINGSTIFFYNTNGQIGYTLGGVFVGGTDGFVAKYNSQGNVIWANYIKSVTEPSFEFVRYISNDKRSNVGDLYLCGEWNSNVLEVYNTNGNLGLTLPNNGPVGTSDTFLLKYSRNPFLLRNPAVTNVVSTKTIELLNYASNVLIEGNNLIVDGNNVSELIFNNVGDTISLYWNPITQRWSMTSINGVQLVNI